MKRTLLMLALFPLIAFGGKEEREFTKTEVTPAVEKAATTFKSSCGCALKITFDAKTITSKNDLGLVKYVVDSVTEGSAKYCTDADSKKAVCQMKSLEIKKENDTKFTYAGGKGVAAIDGQSYPSFDMMTPHLDK